MREFNEMVNARKQRVEESVAAYFGEKLALIKRAPEKFKVTTDASVDYLISGVHDSNIRRVLRLRNYDSIHELMQIARMLDRDSETRHTEQKQTSVGKFEGKQTNKIEANWTARAAAQSSADNLLHLKPIRRDGITCLKCGEVGHIANECPQRRQVNTTNNNKAITNCIIASKWPSKVMVDSGCDRTVIKRSVLPKEQKIVSADGQKLKVVENEVSILGCVTVSIEIGGFTAQVSAAVVEKSPFGMIVGSDWRRNANVAITTFPDASIEIKKCENKATMVGVFIVVPKEETIVSLKTENCNSTANNTSFMTSNTVQQFDVTFEREVNKVVSNVAEEATKAEKHRLQKVLHE
ncbi:blastopia polyprotein-like protein, partial [Leptotrombidium deliense]